MSAVATELSDDAIVPAFYFSKALPHDFGMKVDVASLVGDRKRIRFTLMKQAWTLSATVKREGITKAKVDAAIRRTVRRLESVM